MVVAGHRGLATGLAGLEKAVTGLGRRKRGEEGARAGEQEARSKLSENYELIAKVISTTPQPTSLMTPLFSPSIFFS